MANSYLPIRINKTKQVYSNLFHPQYLRRYKQYNFQFYSENPYKFLWENIIFIRFFRDAGFI